MSLRKVKAIDLAEQIGINRGTMSLFLNGKTNLRQQKLEEIFKYLDIELIIKK
nr:MAG TPA: LAMBDA REPRESSOR (TRIPLE MUTANT)/DNA COMPLEX-DNA COMPLEX, DOUBLE HELIX, TRANSCRIPTION-DNA.1A [Caudoviricetes sp.]